MKKVILITGVSSGFGKATAKLLAEKGNIVYGTVRTDPKKDEPFHLIRMDLTDIASIRSVVSEITAREGRLDVLINNAGMHTGGPIETSPVGNIELQLDTNFLGLIHLTREVLPVMRKQGGGTIINISSIGGLMGLPFQAFYSASKFAIEGFSEALRMEVRPFNILVVVINPGDFHTSSSSNRRKFLAPTSSEDPYNKYFTSALSVIEKDEANGQKPGLLAKKIARIVDCKKPGQRYIVASFEQKLAVLLKYILPSSIFRGILESHYKIK